MNNNNGSIQQQNVYYTTNSNTVQPTPNGYYQWVPPMGTTNGYYHWVPPLGTTNSYYQWVPPEQHRLCGGCGKNPVKKLQTHRGVTLTNPVSSCEACLKKFVRYLGDKICLCEKIADLNGQETFGVCAHCEEQNFLAYFGKETKIDMDRSKFASYLKIKKTNEN